MDYFFIDKWDVRQRGENVGEEPERMGTHEEHLPAPRIIKGH